VRTFRNNQFIALNDGSTIDNIQCVVDFENTTGATSVGTLVEESKGAGQN
jgi:asparaginyl-tRNA synthetase